MANSGHKRTERALAETEERYRQLVELSPDAIHIHQDGKLVFVNKACLRLFGATSPDQLLGRPLLDFIHPDHREMVRERMRVQYEQMRVIPGMEQKALRLDGSTVDVDVKSAPFMFESRPAIQTVVRDITERRRAEDAQRHSQKMEALGTLAGGIAHDFNNILLAIIGNTKLAIADLPVDHPVQQSLAEISKASGRASELVRRILSFGRQQESKREAIQLGPVVEEALKLLRSTLPAMIEIKPKFASGVPAIAGDPTQIHQVVMNLVTNAAYAIGDNGGLIEVALDALNVRDDLARTCADLHEGRYARLTVSDNGCGMDRATLERIFDPFFTTKPPGQGTGLGLSVAHGIMRTHEGAITVHSQPGKTTVFHLYFPAVETAAAPVAAPMHPLGHGRGERVLYLDDDDALVLLTTRLLCRLGYAVTGYTDSADALDAVRSHPHDFDVVITDLSMPGMSGFEFARNIFEIRRDMPVVMVSGYIRSQDQETAALVGIGELVLKPNSVEELGQVLDRLLREQRERGQTD